MCARDQLLPGRRPILIAELMVVAAYAVVIPRDNAAVRSLDFAVAAVSFTLAMFATAAYRPAVLTASRARPAT